MFPAFTKYFPKAGLEPADFKVAVERLLQAKEAITGSISIPPRAATDLGFRVVQFHENG
jgi:hypothetical protein